MRADDGDVDRAEFLLHRIDCGRKLVGLRDIRLHHDGGAAEALDLADHSLGRRLAAHVIDTDRGAAPAENPGCGRADAAAGAGDEGYLASEIAACLVRRCRHISRTPLSPIPWGF